MIEQLTAIVGLATGVVSAIPPVATVLEGRTRRPQGFPPAGIGLSRLETYVPAPPDCAEVARYMRGGWVVGVIGAAYVAYGALVVTGTLEFQSADWLKVLIGGLLILEGAYFLYRVSLRRHMLGGGEEHRAHRVEASLTLSGGDREAVVARSVQAMLAIGAIRATGSFVRHVGEGIELQGGTGPWPRRSDGQRVTLSITPASDEITMDVRSESFWPEPFMRLTNERNVRRLVELIVG